eukprot:1195071-Prorocentrum_minimum.AAC.2
MPGHHAGMSRVEVKLAAEPPTLRPFPTPLPPSLATVQTPSTPLATAVVQTQAEDLVTGMADGYGVKELALFVGSLRATGCVESSEHAHLYASRFLAPRPGCEALSWPHLCESRPTLLAYARGLEVVGALLLHPCASLNKHSSTRGGRYTGDVVLFMSAVDSLTAKWLASQRARAELFDHNDPELAPLSRNIMRAALYSRIARRR